MTLIITAKRDGFRRCGVRHPATPVTHEDGTFTDEQVAALKAEPNLIVVEADTKAKTDAEADAKADAKGKKAAKDK